MRVRPTHAFAGCVRRGAKVLAPHPERQVFFAKLTAITRSRCPSVPRMQTHAPPLTPPTYTRTKRERKRNGYVSVCWGTGILSLSVASGRTFSGNRQTCCGLRGRAANPPDGRQWRSAWAASATASGPPPPPPLPPPHRPPTPTRSSTSVPNPIGTASIDACRLQRPFRPSLTLYARVSPHPGKKMASSSPLPPSLSLARARMCWGCLLCGVSLCRAYVDGTAACVGQRGLCV
jgi:hypothetical protein